MDSPIGLINSQQQPINDFVTELEDKFQAVGVMPLQFISCADRRDAPPHKTRDQISAINSNHSSLVSSTSFIIFRIIPFPILSPGCIVIRVVRPSGCRMNRWLPFCLICRKPMFSNALITFLAGRGLIV